MSTWFTSPRHFGSLENYKTFLEIIPLSVFKIFNYSLFKELSTRFVPTPFPVLVFRKHEY